MSTDTRDRTTSLNPSHSSGAKASYSSTDGESRESRFKSEFIFPFFSEMFRIIHFPQAVSALYMIIYGIQICGSTLWRGSGRIERSDSLSFYTILYDFCDLGVTHKSLSKCIPQYSVVIGIFGVILLSLYLVYLSYRSTHIFIKWQLFICCYICSVICPIMTVVSAALFGRALYELYTTTTSISIAFTIVMLVSLIVNFVIYQYAITFQSLSPILCRDVNAGFDPRVFIEMISLISISTILAPLLDALQNWTTLLAIVIIAILWSRSYYAIYFLPFIRFSMNICFITLLVLGHVNMAIAFVCYFIDVKPYIIAPIEIAVCAIAFGVTYFFFIQRKIKIMKFLKSSPEASTDEAKKAYFDSEKFTSARDAVCYLRVGLANHSDLFCDTSFMRYLIEFYQVKEIVIAVAHCLCFFPSELQYFCYCLGLISKFRELSLGQQFLVFQMSNIHIMRQSSVSLEAAKDVSKIQKKSRSAIGTIREFWNEIYNAKFDISFESLRTLKQLSDEVQASFLDAVEKYPNNQTLSEEFSNFLLEGLGNFSEATTWKRKTRMIEEGKQKIIDYNFLSLVNVYPSYLHDKVLTIHGAFIAKGINTSASYSNMTESSTTDSVSVDNKEEVIITTMCDHGKLRLALQKAFDKIEIPSLKNGFNLAIGMLLLSILFYILAFVLVPIITDDASSRLSEEYYATSTILRSQVIGEAASIQNVILRGLFDGYSFVENLTGITESTLNSTASSLYEPFIYINGKLLDGLSKFRSFFSPLMDDVSSFSSTLNILVNTSIPYKSYEDDTVISTDSLFMRGAIVKYFDDSKVTDILENRTFLNSLSINSLAISNASSSLIESMTSSGESSMSTVEIYAYVIGLVPTIIFVFIFGYMCVSNMSSLFKDMKNMSDMMRKIKEDVVEASLKPISLKNKEIQKDSVHPPHQENYAKTFLPLTFALSIIIIAIIFIVTIILIRNYIENVNGVYSWLLTNFHRSLSICRYIIIFNMGLTGLINQTEAQIQLQTEQNNVVSYHEELISSIIGFDSGLNEDQFMDACHENVTNDYAYFLTCISLDKQVSMAYSLFETLSKNYMNLSGSGCLNTNDYGYLIYLADYSLLLKLRTFQTEFYLEAELHISGIESDIQGLWIAGIVLSVFSFCFTIFLLHMIKNGFEGARQLIGLLPPLSITKSESIMRLILGKRNDDDDISMSVSEALVFRSSNATMVMNRNQIIEMVNPSLEQMTGFSPDKVLGQPITWLIPPATSSSSSNDDDISSAQFYQRVEQMKTGIGERTASMNVRCQTDLDNLLTVKATVIGITEDDSDTGEVSSFVILFRNMDNEMEQKKAIHDAKNRTDQLLEALVPCQVLSVIKQQSKASLFVSKLGTVIFVKIEGFIDCIQNMAPKQSMEALKSIYDKFDIAASKFPAVHGIKYNDELYVGCCGLFDFKENPQAQADQAIHFCFELLKSIEDINEELGLELKLRIGVNMGGPLVGSVLNPEMPSFDILGDLMGLGVKLASCGQIGVVQVGESVSHYLSASEFNITEGSSFASYTKTTEKSFIVSKKEAK